MRLRIEKATRTLPHSIGRRRFQGNTWNTCGAGERPRDCAAVRRPAGGIASVFISGGMN